MRKPPKILIACSIWLSGCAPLSEIRDFAALSKRAAESFPPMMRDVKESYLRQRELSHLQQGSSLQEAGKQAQADCEKSELCRVVPDLIGAGQVLENYMKVMGQLAADDLTSFDQSIKGFADQLQTSAKIKDKERDAVRSLATFLFNAVASGYRQKRLAETLTKHDDDIRVLTEALLQITGDYVTQLGNEELAMRGYYEGAVGRRQEDAVLKVLVYEIYGRDRQALEKKRQAARSYQEFLRTLQKAHHELSQKASRLTATEARRLGATFAVEIDKQVQAIGKAF